MSSKSEHWVSQPKIAFGKIRASGVSTWDIPEGHRLRREMSRSTIFNSIPEMKRWAKKYKINVDHQITTWELLSLSLSESFI